MKFNIRPYSIRLSRRFIQNGIKRGVALLLAIILSAPEAWSLPANHASSPAPRAAVQRTGPSTIPDMSFAGLPYSPKDLHPVAFHPGGDKHLVIYLQDPHANIGAQESLARGLGEWINKLGVRDVFVEGGWGDCSLTRWRKARGDAFWSEKSRGMLLDGRLAGEEYLSLTGDQEFAITGVEDKVLYTRSVELFARMQARRDKVMAFLGRAEGYSERILVQKLDDASRKFFVQLDKTEDPLERWDLVKAEMPRAGVLPEAHSLLKRIERIWRMQADAAKEGAQTSDPSLGISQKWLIARMPRLLAELQDVEDRTIHALLSDPDAALAWRIRNHTRLLSRASRLGLMPEDVTVIRNDVRAMPSVSWQAWINRKLRESGSDERLLAEDALEPFLTDTLWFYRLVNRRDRAFAHNFLSNLNNTSQNKTDQNTPVVLITGGHHTAPVVRRLHEAGHPVAIFSPIVEFESDARQYESRLFESMGALRATSAGDRPAVVRDAKPADLRKLAAALNPAFLSVAGPALVEAARIAEASGIQGARMSEDWQKDKKESDHYLVAIEWAKAILSNYRSEYGEGKLVFIGGASRRVWQAAKYLSRSYRVDPRDIVYLDLPRSAVATTEDIHKFMRQRGVFDKEGVPITVIDNAQDTGKTFRRVDDAIHTEDAGIRIQHRSLNVADGSVAQIGSLNRDQVNDAFVFFERNNWKERDVRRRELVSYQKRGGKVVPNYLNIGDIKHFMGRIKEGMNILAITPGSLSSTLRPILPIVKQWLVNHGLFKNHDGRDLQREGLNALVQANPIPDADRQDRLFGDLLADERASVLAKQAVGSAARKRLEKNIANFRALEDEGARIKHPRVLRVPVGESRLSSGGSAILYTDDIRSCVGVAVETEGAKKIKTIGIFHLYYARSAAKERIWEQTDEFIKKLSALKAKRHRIILYYSKKRGGRSQKHFRGIVNSLKKKIAAAFPHSVVRILEETGMTSTNRNRFWPTSMSVDKGGVLIDHSYDLWSRYYSWDEDFGSKDPRSSGRAAAVAGALEPAVSGARMAERATAVEPLNRSISFKELKKDRPKYERVIERLVEMCRQTAERDKVTLYDESQIRNIIAEDTRGLGQILLTDDDRIKGFLLAGMFQDTDSAYIRFTATDPAFRGEGVFRDLASAFAMSAKKQGIPSAVLRVREGNAVARAIYRHYGFVSFTHVDKKDYQGFLNIAPIDSLLYASRWDAKSRQDDVMPTVIRIPGFPQEAGRIRSVGFDRWVITRPGGRQRKLNHLTGFAYEGRVLYAKTLVNGSGERPQYHRWQTEHRPEILNRDEVLRLSGAVRADLDSLIVTSPEAPITDIHWVSSSPAGQLYLVDLKLNRPHEGDPGAYLGDVFVTPIDSVGQIPDFKQSDYIGNIKLEFIGGQGLVETKGTWTMALNKARDKEFGWVNGFIRDRLEENLGKVPYTWKGSFIRNVPTFGARMAGFGENLDSRRVLHDYLPLLERAPFAGVLDLLDRIGYGYTASRYRQFTSLAEALADNDDWFVEIPNLLMGAANWLGRHYGVAADIKRPAPGEFDLGYFAETFDRWVIDPIRRHVGEQRVGMTPSDQQRAYAEEWSLVSAMVEAGRVPKASSKPWEYFVSLVSGMPVYRQADSDVTDTTIKKIAELAGNGLKKEFLFMDPVSADQFHVTLFQVLRSDSASKDSLPFDSAQAVREQIRLQKAVQIVKKSGPLTITLRGLSLSRDGTVIVQGFAENTRLWDLRAQLAELYPDLGKIWGKKPFSQISIARPTRALTAAEWKKLHRWVRERRDLDLGIIHVRRPVLIAGHGDNVRNYVWSPHQPSMEMLKPYNEQLVRSGARMALSSFLAEALDPAAIKGRDYFEWKRIYHEFLEFNDWSADPDVAAVENDAYRTILEQFHKEIEQSIGYETMLDTQDKKRKYAVADINNAKTKLTRHHQTLMARVYRRLEGRLADRLSDAETTASGEFIDPSLGTVDFASKLKEFYIKSMRAMDYMDDFTPDRVGYPSAEAAKHWDFRSPLAVTPFLVLSQAGFEPGIRSEVELTKAIVENGLASVELLPAADGRPPGLILHFAHEVHNSWMNYKFSSIACLMLKRPWSKHWDGDEAERDQVVTGEIELKRLVFASSGPESESTWQNRRRILDLALAGNFVVRGSHYQIFDQEGADRAGKFFGRTEGEAKAISSELMAVLLDIEENAKDQMGSAYVARVNNSGIFRGKMLEQFEKKHRMTMADMQRSAEAGKMIDDLLRSLGLATTDQDLRERASRIKTKVAELAALSEMRLVLRTIFEKGLDGDWLLANRAADKTTGITADLAADQLHNRISDYKHVLRPALESPDRQGLSGLARAASVIRIFDALTQGLPEPQRFIRVREWLIRTAAAEFGASEPALFSAFGVESKDASEAEAAPWAGLDEKISGEIALFWSIFGEPIDRHVIQDLHVQGDAIDQIARTADGLMRREVEVPNPAPPFDRQRDLKNAGALTAAMVELDKWAEQTGRGSGETGGTDYQTPEWIAAAIKVREIAERAHPDPVQFAHAADALRAARHVTGFDPEGKNHDPDGLFVTLAAISGQILERQEDRRVAHPEKPEGPETASDTAERSDRARLALQILNDQRFAGIWKLERRIHAYLTEVSQDKKMDPKVTSAILTFVNHRGGHAGTPEIQRELYFEVGRFLDFGAGARMAGFQGVLRRFARRAASMLAAAGLWVFGGVAPIKADPPGQGAAVPEMSDRLREFKGALEKRYNDEIRRRFREMDPNHEPGLKEFLISVLRSDDYHMHASRRGIAAELLGSLNDPSVIPALAEALKSNQREIIKPAIESLGRFSHRPEAVAAFSTALNGETLHPSWLYAVAQALAKIDDPSAIPVLDKILDSKNIDARHAAIKALGASKDPRSIAALSRLMDTKKFHYSWAGPASEQLGNIGDPSAIPALSAALDIDDADVRNAAIAALGKFKDPSAVKALAKSFNRDKFHYSWAELAVTVMGQMGDPSAIPLLGDEAVRERGVVSRAAIDALAKMGAPAAIQLTRAALSKGAPESEYAMTKLKGMKLPGYVVDVYRFYRTLNDPDAFQRFVDISKEARYEQIPEMFVSDLAALKTSAAADSIFIVFGRHRPEYREKESMLSQGLESIGTPRAMFYLHLLHGRVEEALASLKEVDPAESILNLALDNNEVATEVINIFTRSEWPGLDRMLAQELRRGTAESGRAAAEILSRRKNPAAVPELIRILDAESDIDDHLQQFARTLAAHVLGKIGRAEAIPVLIREQGMTVRAEGTSDPCYSALGAFDRPDAVFYRLLGEGRAKQAAAVENSVDMARDALKHRNMMVRETARDVLKIKNSYGWKEWHDYFYTSHRVSYWMLSGITGFAVYLAAEYLLRRLSISLARISRGRFVGPLRFFAVWPLLTGARAHREQILLLLTSFKRTRDPKTLVTILRTSQDIDELDTIKHLVTDPAMLPELIHLSQTSQKGRDARTYECAIEMIRQIYTNPSPQRPLSDLEWERILRENLFGTLSRLCHHPGVLPQLSGRYAPIGELITFVRDQKPGLHSQIEDSIDRYLQKFAGRRSLGRRLAAVNDILAFAGTVHDNLPLVLNACVGIGVPVSRFEPLRKLLPINNPLTRIIRMLGEPKGFYASHRTFVRRCRWTGQFSRLLRSIEAIVVSKRNAAGGGHAQDSLRSAPNEVDGFLTLLETQRSHVNALFFFNRKFYWFYNTENVLRYYRNVGETLILPLYYYFLRHGDDPAAIARLKSDLNRELQGIAWGGFRGLSPRFKEQYGLTTADELALLSRYVPIHNYSSRDYAHTYGQLRQALANREEQWFAEVPSELRRRFKMMGTAAFMTYDSSDAADAGRRTAFHRELESRVANPKHSVQDLCRLMAKKPDQYLAVPILEKKRAVMEFALHQSEQSPEPYRKAPGSDPEIYDWLNQWAAFIQDTWKVDHADALRRMVRETVAPIRGEPLETLLKAYGLDRFSSGTFKRPKDLLPRPKRLRTILNSDRTNPQKVRALADHFLSNMSSGVSAAQIQDPAVIRAIVEDPVFRTTPLAREAFAIAHGEMLAKIRDGSYDEHKRTALADKIAGELINVMADDLETIRAETVRYHLVEGTTESEYQVGFFDDLLHLMAFMMTGVCTWASRPGQVKDVRSHFGKIAIQNADGRLVGVSQVQLVRSGIQGRHYLDLRTGPGWKALALTGINLAPGDTGMSQEHAVLAILEAAQRYATAAGLQGAVIPIEANTHTNQPAVGRIIQDLHARGWLKTTSLDHVVHLTPDDEWDYQDVYLIQIPEDHRSLQPSDDQATGAELSVSGTAETSCQFMQLVFEDDVSAELTRQVEAAVGIISEDAMDLAEKRAVGREFRIETDPTKDTSSIVRTDKGFTLKIGKNIQYDQGSFEPVQLKLMISGLVLAALLPDYEKLQAASRVNENAYYKLKVLQGLLLYPARHELYHYLIRKRNWSAAHPENYLHLMTEEQRRKALADAAAELRKANEAVHEISQWNVFLNLMDNADPAFLVSNYLEILSRDPSVSPDSIAQLITQIAEVPVDNRVSIAGLREAYRAFLLNRDTTLAIDEGRVRTDYDHFSRREEFNSLKERLASGQNRNEFYNRDLRNLLESMLPRQAVDEEIARLFGENLFENPNRPRAIGNALSEMFIRYYGNGGRSGEGGAYNAFREHLMGVRGFKNLPYLRFGAQGLAVGDDADDFDFLRFTSDDGGVTRQLTGDDGGDDDAGGGLMDAGDPPMEDWTHDLFKLPSAGARMADSDRVISRWAQPILRREKYALYDLRDLPEARSGPLQKGTFIMRLAETLIGVEYSAVRSRSNPKPDHAEANPEPRGYRASAKSRIKGIAQSISMLFHTPSVLYLATDPSKKLIGYGMLGIYRGDLSGLINGLYVLPENQGQRIGSALMTRMVMTAQNTGLDEIRWRSRIAAVDFYQNILKKLGIRFEQSPQNPTDFTAYLRDPQISNSSNETRPDPQMDASGARMALNRRGFIGVASNAAAGILLGLSGQAQEKNDLEKPDFEKPDLDSLNGSAAIERDKARVDSVRRFAEKLQLSRMEAAKNGLLVFMTRDLRSEAKAIDPEFERYLMNLQQASLQKSDQKKGLLNAITSREADWLAAINLKFLAPAGCFIWNDLYVTWVKPGDTGSERIDRLIPLKTEIVEIDGKTVFLMYGTAWKGWLTGMAGFTLRNTGMAFVDARKALVEAEAIRKKLTLWEGRTVDGRAESQYDRAERQFYQKEFKGMQLQEIARKIAVSVARNELSHARDAAGGKEPPAFEMRSDLAELVGGEATYWTIFRMIGNAREFKTYGLEEQIALRDLANQILANRGEAADFGNGIIVGYDARWIFLKRVIDLILETSDGAIRRAAQDIHTKKFGRPAAFEKKSGARMAKADPAHLSDKKTRKRLQEKLVRFIISLEPSYAEWARMQLLDYITDDLNRDLYGPGLFESGQEQQAQVASVWARLLAKDILLNKYPEAVRVQKEPLYGAVQKAIDLIEREDPAWTQYLTASLIKMQSEQDQYTDFKKFNKYEWIHNSEIGDFGVVFASIPAGFILGRIPKTSPDFAALIMECVRAANRHILSMDPDAFAPAMMDGGDDAATVYLRRRNGMIDRAIQQFDWKDPARTERRFLRENRVSTPASKKSSAESEAAEGARMAINKVPGVFAEFAKMSFAKKWVTVIVWSAFTAAAILTIPEFGRGRAFLRPLLWTMGQLWIFTLAAPYLAKRFTGEGSRWLAVGGLLSGIYVVFHLIPSGEAAWSQLTASSAKLFERMAVVFISSFASTSLLKIIEDVRAGRLVDLRRTAAFASRWSLLPAVVAGFLVYYVFIPFTAEAFTDTGTRIRWDLTWGTLLGTLPSKIASGAFGVSQIKSYRDFVSRAYRSWVSLLPINFAYFYAVMALGWSAAPILSNAVRGSPALELIFGAQPVDSYLRILAFAGFLFRIAEVFIMRRAIDPDHRSGARMAAVSGRTVMVESSGGVVLERITNGRLTREIVEKLSATHKRLIIRGVRTGDYGAINLAGRKHWVQLKKHPNRAVVLELYKGFLSQVDVLDDDGRTVMDSYPMSFIYDAATGNIVDSFAWTLMPSQFEKLDGVIIKGLRLNASGALWLGRKDRRRWLAVSDHPNAPAEIRVEHGLVTEVSILDKNGEEIENIQVPKIEDKTEVSILENPGKVIKIIKLSKIEDDAGTLKDVFYGELEADVFAKLDRVWIRNFTLPAQALQVAGRPWGSLGAGNAGGHADLWIEKGLIRKVIILKDFKTGLPRTVEFAELARPDGEVVDTFIRQLNLTKFKKLDRVTIRKLRVSPSGMLKVAGLYGGSYPGLEGLAAEVDVEKGAIVRVRILGADGKVVRQQRAIRVYDRSGALVDSFLTQYKARWILSSDGHYEVRDIHSDATGKFWLDYEPIFSNHDFPNAYADAVFDDGVLTALTVTENAKGEAIRVALDEASIRQPALRKQFGHSRGLVFEKAFRLGLDALSEPYDYQSALRNPDHLAEDEGNQVFDFTRSAAWTAEHRRIEVLDTKYRLHPSSTYLRDYLVSLKAFAAESWDTDPDDPHSSGRVDGITLNLVHLAEGNESGMRTNAEQLIRELYSMRPEFVQVRLISFFEAYAPLLEAAGRHDIIKFMQYLQNAHFTSPSSIRQMRDLSKVLDEGRIPDLDHAGDRQLNLFDEDPAQGARMAKLASKNAMPDDGRWRGIAQTTGDLPNPVVVYPAAGTDAKTVRKVADAYASVKEFAFIDRGYDNQFLKPDLIRELQENGLEPDRKDVEEWNRPHRGEVGPFVINVTVARSARRITLKLYNESYFDHDARAAGYTQGFGLTIVKRPGDDAEFSRPPHADRFYGKVFDETTAGGWVCVTEARQPAQPAIERSGMKSRLVTGDYGLYQKRSGGRAAAEQLVKKANQWLRENPPITLTRTRSGPEEHKVFRFALIDDRTHHGRAVRSHKDGARHTVRLIGVDPSKLRTSQDVVGLIDDYLRSFQQGRKYLTQMKDKDWQPFTMWSRAKKDALTAYMGARMADSYEAIEQSKEDLDDYFRQILAPLKGLSGEALKSNFKIIAEEHEAEIFKKMIRIRMAYAHKALIDHEPETYYAWIWSGSPDCGICYVVSSLMFRALHSIGIPVRQKEAPMEPREYHRYILVGKGRGAFAVDLAAGQFLPEYYGRAAIGDPRTYHTKINAATLTRYEPNYLRRLKGRVSYFKRVVFPRIRAKRLDIKIEAFENEFDRESFKSRPSSAAQPALGLPLVAGRDELAVVAEAARKDAAIGRMPDGARLAVEAAGAAAFVTVRRSGRQGLTRVRVESRPFSLTVRLPIEAATTVRADRQVVGGNEVQTRLSQTILWAEKIIRSDAQSAAAVVERVDLDYWLGDAVGDNFAERAGLIFLQLERIKKRGWQAEYSVSAGLRIKLEMLASSNLMIREILDRVADEPGADRPQEAQVVVVLGPDHPLIRDAANREILARDASGKPAAYLLLGARLSGEDWTLADLEAASLSARVIGMQSPDQAPERETVEFFSPLFGGSANPTDLLSFRQGKTGPSFARLKKAFLHLFRWSDRVLHDSLLSKQTTASSA